MKTAIFVLTAWLAADLLAGLFHWFEDRVLTDDKKIPRWLETIRADNGDHHRKPGAIVRFTLWQNMETSALVAWPLAGLSAACGGYWICLVFVFVSFGNVVHRFAHDPRTRKPIRWLQKTGLFISNEQHHRHHYRGIVPIAKEQSTGNYCVMSSWLNPILDGIGLWSVLNKICRVFERGAL